MRKPKFFLILVVLMLLIGVFFAFKYVLGQAVCTCGSGDGCDESCTGPTDPDCAICNESLNKFTQGSTVKINLPAGGCSTQAKVKLPMNSNICKTSLDISYTGTTSNLTPYLWVPIPGPINTRRLLQIDTSNGNFVAMYGNSLGGDYIWDCTASCSTNIPAPAWTQRSPDNDCAFALPGDPSQTTVIPGQQVWVTNSVSGTTTQLIFNEIAGKYECEATYAVGGFGSGPHGVTVDNQGNIWIGGYGDNNIYKFKSDGTFLFNKNISYGGYGMIADSYGYVWISTGTGRDVIAINTNDCSAGSCPIAYSELDFVSGMMTHAIAIDNEGDIWVTDEVMNIGEGKIYEIDGLDADGGPVGDVVRTCNTGLSFCCSGITVDKNNNVWFNNSISNGGNPNLMTTTYMIEGGNCASLYSYPNVCPTWPSNGIPYGISADANNNVWIVCKTGGLAELSFNGANIVKILERDLLAAIYSCAPGCISGDEWNPATIDHSDMTGLRTPSISISIGGGTYPISNNLSNFGCEMEDILKTCSCGGCQITSCEEYYGADCCEVPIEVCTISAGGEYTLSNLNIEYKTSPLPPAVGGLVPCGRHIDDPTTNLDETSSCAICHIFVGVKRIVDFLLLYLLFPLAGIGLTASGVSFIAAAGNPEGIKNAKGIFTLTLKGIVFALTAWLLIELIIIVTVPNSRPWHNWKNISCPVAPCNSNGICQTTIGEDAQNCPTDCRCDFNGVCDPVKEQVGVIGVDPQACPDCAVCGNDIRDIDEECDDPDNDGDDYGPTLNQKIADNGAKLCSIITSSSTCGIFKCSSNCKLDKTDCK